jgi:hypothetical protein
VKPAVLVLLLVLLLLYGKMGVLWGACTRFDCIMLVFMLCGARALRGEVDRDEEREPFKERCGAYVG